MKIELETLGDVNRINAYGPGEVTINATVYRASLIVAPTRVMPDWRPQAFEQITAADLTRLLEFDPEVILLGTGERLRFPAAHCLQALVAAQVGFEVMDTGAACRTYNILLAEGRRVVAALLPIAP